jgi:transposase
MPPEQIDSLADDVKPLVLGLLRQISGLTARVDELLAQNKALLARIAELEVLHGKPPKTPDNSSLPPSRGQKGNVAEPTRVKKDRKGRPGAARALAENPDATRDIYAERCACGATLDEAGQELARAWDHVDLPPIKPITTRINLFRATCLCCKARVTARAPADMPEGSPFGPGIKAAVAYLHGCQLVGFKRLTELCEGLFGLTISQGAISNMLARMGKPFGVAAEQIAATVRGSEVIASDETSARVKGKTHWQWTFGCATAVYHVIAPTRGKCVPTTFSPARGRKCGCRIACRRSAHTPRRTSSASRI